VWLIANSMMKSLTINHNYLGNLSNLSLKGNLKEDGADSSIYNN